MKKTVKVAVAVLIVGVVVMLAGFAMAGFDLNALASGGTLVSRQYEAEGDVTELVVADRNADIVITPSEDGKVRLTCWENEEATYDIREQDGMLYIEKVEQQQNGLGAWFGFHQSGKLEVELPAGVALDISNDNGAEMVYAQQVWGYGQRGDVLLALSTSGYSENVLLAAKTAAVKGMSCIAITGEGGSPLAAIASLTIALPAKGAREVQELTMPVYHFLCKCLEDSYFPI